MSEINEDKAAAQLAEILALEYGIPPDKAKQIRIAAALHDIGKQKIDKKILDKPGKLTATEFEVVKTHTILGAEMLSSIQGALGEKVRNICLWHHERFDGGGYWGKRADDIPSYVEIVTIADVFTALVCKRPYKEAWPPEEAIAYMEVQSGKQFNPDLIAVFIPLAKNNSQVQAIFSRR